MTAPDMADFIDRYHRALDEFFRGDPAAAKGLYSHREDVSLANPFGPVALGWPPVGDRWCVDLLGAILRAVREQQPLHRTRPPAPTPPGCSHC